MDGIYIVTGAAGFLGSVVCRRLVEMNCRVRALVLPNDKYAKYLPEQVEIFEGDVTDKESLKPLFISDGAPITVLHIASIVTVEPQFSQRVINVNVVGTQNIIDLCQDSPSFNKLVYCGSTGALIETPKGEPIREPDSYNADKVVGCYSQSKAMASQAVVDAARRGLNCCIVHPTGIMGPDDFSMSETTSTLVKIIKGEMPVGISGTFNLVDVRDLANGVIAAAERGKRGESYILGNEQVSFRHFAHLISRESGCRGVKHFLPASFALRIARQMERKAKRRGQKPIMTTFSVYNLTRNNDFDSSKARRELGFTTRPYIQTIHDEIEWLKNEGVLPKEPQGHNGVTDVAVNAYQRVENGVVKGYKNIEDSVVGGYKATERGFVNAYKSIEKRAIKMGRGLSTGNSSRRRNYGEK